MTKKIVITKAGYDATTETNVDNQVFNSDYDTLKYYSSGYVDVTVSGSDAEQTVTHNLGYIPFFIAFVNYYAGASANNFNMVPGTFSDVGVYDTAQAYADSTKLYFKVFTNSASLTFRFYYKIFRNNTGL